MADNKSRERFSPLFYANIKALWESGGFGSVEEFVKYGKSLYKKFPSLDTINKKIRAEGWDKNKAKKELEERAEASYSELFEAEGMGDIEVVKRICDGIHAPDRTVKALVEYAKKVDGKIDDDTLKKFADMMNYDLRTANDYIIERNKMVGAYPASKHKHSGKLTINDVKSMSLEEAVDEHVRIHQNFVAAGLCKTN